MHSSITPIIHHSNTPHCLRRFQVRLIRLCRIRHRNSVAIFSTGLFSLN